MKLRKFDLEHKYCNWWLRSADSADSDYNCYVSHIYDYGYVSYYYADDCNGAFLACIVI